MPKKQEEKNTTTPRQPIIAIMGHIDHGKSTLLDYIRKTNVVEKEAGGITQHVGAYEVTHKDKSGVDRHITFLDTPGHEAFAGIRSRGASVADIAVLVVSAEEGVKPQTLEALHFIKKSETPYIVAINKIDKPGADIERTKQNLAENEIYLEGYGGDIPFTAISAKTGEGVPELLDLMLLVAELEELKGDPKKASEGVVIESNLDTRKGISATLIVKDGTLTQGDCIVAGNTFSSVRMMENFQGAKIKTAAPGTTVSIIGWSIMPKVGDTFTTCSNKKEAEKIVGASPKKNGVAHNEKEFENKVVVPIIVKADVQGSLEAVLHEIKKIEQEGVKIKLLFGGVGDISEADLKVGIGAKNPLFLGFNVKAEAQTKQMAERLGITLHTFDIIYKLLEWLWAEIKAKKPKVSVEETTGRAKIMKIFSKDKDTQVIGGKVETGEINVGSEIRILRREAEDCSGKIKNLQQQKAKTSSVKKDAEFGAMVEAKIEIAPGDRIESFVVVEK